jgi:hypothetical protein
VYAQQLQYFQYYGGYYEPSGAWIQGQQPTPAAAAPPPPGVESPLVAPPPPPPPP